MADSDVDPLHVFSEWRVEYDSDGRTVDVRRFLARWV
jgi:hypothetical protein